MPNLVNTTFNYWTDGKQVVVLRNGIKGIAKCNPTDDFDLAIGLKIAFGRLLNNEKRQKQINDGDKVYCYDLDNKKNACSISSFIYRADDVSCKLLKNLGLLFKNKVEAANSDKKFVQTYWRVKSCK